MATASPRKAEVPRAAQQLPSAGRQEQQQQGATLSVEPCGETNSTEYIKSGADEAAMVLQALQELPTISCMKEAADQPPQEVALLGASGVAVAVEVDPVTAAGDKQEGEQQNNSREQVSTHGREPVLLWSVRKGLAPIVAAAVDGFSRGEAVLETPSSAAAAPVTKEAATLEDETPRTSAPSSEVSPTNNLCSYKTFQSSSVAATIAASTSGSWCAAAPTSRAAGGTEADDTDCFLPAAVQSPAEILAAAAATAVSEAASSAGALPAADGGRSTKGPAEFTGAARETPPDPAGHNIAAEITPSVSADAVAGTAADTSGTAAVAEVQTTATTSADTAAILCSPAALSLLATPCPVGGAAAGRPACATGAQASAGPDAAAEGGAAEKGPAETAVDNTAGMTPASGAAGVAPANVDDAMGEDADAAAAADSEKNAQLTQCGDTYLQGALLKDASQEMLEILTECPVHDEERQGGQLQEGGSSEAAGHEAAAAESFSCGKGGGWEAAFAEVDDTRRLSLMTLAAEDLAKTLNSGAAAAEVETAEVAEKDEAAVVAGRAAVSQEADLAAVGSLPPPPPPPPREKAYRNAEHHRGGSLLLWECRSQLSAAVEEEAAAAAALCPPPQPSLKALSQEDEEERQQQQLGGLATGDSSEGLKNISAGLAPLSATSCCSEFSASPFAAAFKGDVSPVSCCSSSSTASVASPTSSPLSSASCGPLACCAAAGVTGPAAPAAANEAAAPGEGAAGGETTAAAGPTAAAQPSDSAAAGGEGKGEDANGISLPDMKTASAAAASAAAPRDSNAPTWYVGFRLPLGAEGRQVLLRRLRRAYHAAPPTTRDAVLASHGLYFSRVPFATVSDLFKLSHLLGVFDFAVQCSHEFGGSGAAGGASVSAGGGGGSHGGKKNHSHGRSANKNGNQTSQRQLCSGTGIAGGEEGRAAANSPAAVVDALSLAGGIVPPHLGAAMTPAAAAAGGRKSTAAAAAPRAGAAAAAAHCGDARKGGNAELAEQLSSAESNSAAARGASKERAAAAAGDFGEVGLVPAAAGARGGAAGRGDASAKNDEEELQAALKAAAAAPRNRVPQQKRSAAGRSSVCRAAARQQQAEQQQQHSLLKEIEILKSAEAAGGRSSGGDRNVPSRNVDWQTQQHILLQQLLQAGLAEQEASAAGGTDGKSTLEAEALALLNGELGKAAASAATNALLPSFAGGGCCATKETQQQQQQLDEQLLILQLQEHAKAAAASCRRGGNKTVDTPLESKNLRVEQQSQCFLSEAQQSRPRGGLQQQHQQQQAAGGRENVNGGRAGAKRSSRPADVLLQHEQRQWCSWPPSAPAAGDESSNTWDRQTNEGLTKAQLPSPADLLPFLASAAEQLRNNSYVPPAGAAAARLSYRGSRKSEGKAVLEAALNNDCNGSGSSSSSTDASLFDWNGFLMENYLSTVREQPQQQQQQGQSDAVLFSASGSSTSANTRASLIRAASPAAAVGPRQPESRVQEEEIVRLTKRARTTTTTTTITTTTTRPTGGALSVAAGHEATGAGASSGLCAGLLGKEGLSQDYTPEEEALLSALLVAVGSSVREQQQQRRWTVNTAEEITRLLLQLNNTNSNSGTEEEEVRGEGDLVRRASLLQTTKDSGAHGDGGFKHSSSSSTSPCGRAPPFSSTSSSGNSVSSYGSASKDGSGLGFRTSSSKSSSPTSVSVSPAENACTSASLANTSVDAGAAAAHHRGAEGATYDFALQSETRGVATHEPQERFTMLPFLQGNFVPAAEQQQPQQEAARRLLTSRGFSGGRNSCSSSVADSAAAGVGSRNRGQIDSSTSSRDGHTDIFLQLTSQLQLLSAQVMQQQESQPEQQHHEHPAIEQQYQHHLQTQQACGALQKSVSGPSALTGVTAGTQEETVTAVSGRLCSAEKASEYAAGVQLLQLVELLQVQHRVSRLLSLFPKAPTSAASPTSLASVAAASPSPASVSAAPPRSAGPPAAAAAATVLAPDSADIAAADAPAATESFASLLAALASTILEGKASTANQATETPASMLLGLALGKTDGASLLKGGGNSEPVHEPVDLYDVQQQQQQQRVPLPNRGPGSRGSTTKGSNSKRTANRSSNNKGSSTKTSSGKGSNRQGGDRKFSSAVGTELVADQAAAAGGGSGPAGRGKGVPEATVALPKQQEAIVRNCVSHSNSFSTCCSEDVADLCTSRGSSSSSGTKSSHDSSGNLLDGMCSAESTYDRGFAHESYSCGQSRENMVDTCMR